MAHQEVSVLTPENNPFAQYIQIIDGQPMVSSKALALRFQKKHKNVLAEIERIRSYLPPENHGLNFQPMVETVAIGCGATRQNKAYLLSEQAAYTLCAGFTGRAATLWRWELFAAFLHFKNAHYQSRLEALNSRIEETRQGALAQGMALQRRATPARRRQMRRALAYKAKALSNRDIAKLMDLSNMAVWHLLKDARALGMGV